MTDKNTQMLKQAIRDYLQWMRSMETRGSKKLMHYGLLLVDFIDFVKKKNVVWEDMFTFHTLKGFRKYTSTNNPSDTIRGLSLYLFENGRIPQPLPNPCYQIHLQKLFTKLKLTTPTHIRTYAMVHLAFFMGLRPGEISRIKLDDICFKKKELNLPKRMENNLKILPVPEKAIKAIAAYVLKARPESKYRNLFLSLKSPYKPISAGTVTRYISKTMKQSGLLSSPYSLRHTYALNLINAGATIYESKEMQGTLKANTSP
ncbi:MAG: tyrosine-type recombinase/integrase [Candidatus Hydrothermarchaeales archaeon]